MGSADSDSQHWTGMGCGVGMMDSDATVSNKCIQTTKFVLKIILAIISYPIMVVIGPSLLMVGGFLA